MLALGACTAGPWARRATPAIQAIRAPPGGTGNTGDTGATGGHWRAGPDRLHRREWRHRRARCDRQPGQHGCHRRQGQHRRRRRHRGGRTRPMRSLHLSIARAAVKRPIAVVPAGRHCRAEVGPLRSRRRNRRDGEGRGGFPGGGGQQLSREMEAAQNAADNGVIRCPGTGHGAGCRSSPNSGKRTNADIARSAETALNAHAFLPADAVKVMVDHGWITLSGEVQWQHERESASDFVSHLVGVHGVENQISPSILGDAEDTIQRDIEAGLARLAMAGTQPISASVHGADVTLSGTVHAWHDRDSAMHCARVPPACAASSTSSRSHRERSSHHL